MSSVELLKEVAKNLTAYDIVTRVEFLGCKVRARLVNGYVLDLPQSNFEKVQLHLEENKRILGWDNALITLPLRRILPIFTTLTERLNRLTCLEIL